MFLLVQEQQGEQEKQVQTMEGVPEHEPFVKGQCYVMHCVSLMRVLLH